MQTEETRPESWRDVKMCACTKCTCTNIAAYNFPNKEGLCHPCNMNLHGLEKRFE